MLKEKMTFTLVAGVDEAGRGPLAGPVMAGAVILDPQRPIKGLRDSKLLSAQQRLKLAQIIQDQALAYSVAEASVEEIDQFNILKASLLAMRRAIAGLSIKPHEVWIDGNQAIHVPCIVKTFVKGDQTIPAISAASILAKVTRDAVMLEYDQQFPQYGFAQHKGYCTELHRARLKQWGPCTIHRRTFSPVQELT